MKEREHKGKKIIDTTFLSGAFVGLSFDLQTTSQIELTIEGQKRKVTQNVLHSYCPFCGEKYPEPDEGKSIE